MYDSFPIQIGWRLSVKKIDTFFERNEDARGFKFDVDSKGNVFIVEMVLAEYASVVSRLKKFFEVPNGGVIFNPPIDIVGSAGKKNSFELLRLIINLIIFSYPIIAHYRPNGRGYPSASDITICPSLPMPPKPPVPPPPRHKRCTLPILRRRAAPRTSRHLEIPPVGQCVGSVILDFFFPNFSWSYYKSIVIIYIGKTSCTNDV
jgi:hypothetical protein